MNWVKFDRGNLFIDEQHKIEGLLPKDGEDVLCDFGNKDYRVLKWDKTNGVFRSKENKTDVFFHVRYWMRIISPEDMEVANA